MPTPVRVLTVAQAVNELKTITSLPWTMVPLTGLNLIEMDLDLYKRFESYSEDTSIKEMVELEFGDRAVELIKGLLNVGALSWLVMVGLPGKFHSDTIGKLAELKTRPTN